MSEGRYVAATPSHINLAAFQSGVVGTIGDDVVTNEGVAETPKRITIAGSQSGVGGTSRDVGLERAKTVAGGSSHGRRTGELTASFAAPSARPPASARLRVVLLRRQQF